MHRHRPDNPDAQDVSRVAALLDTTEFRVFGLAYQRWFGRHSDDALIEPYFVAYMFQFAVPFWVRYFTREVMTRDRAGILRAGDYGLTQPPASPRMLRRGRNYAILLLAICMLLLLLVSHAPEELLEVAKNCYFPPCY